MVAEEWLPIVLSTVIGNASAHVGDQTKLNMSDKPHIEEDWWTPDQVEMANDSSRIWEKRAFVAQSGYWIQGEGSRLLGQLAPGEGVPEGAILEPGAWDHEHCALCWKKIMKKGGDFHEGYTDGKDWLCPECYGKYVAPVEE
jgi:hypothetical protein